MRKDSLELWFEKQYEEFGKDAVLVGGVSCPGVSREQVDAAKEAVLHARLYFPIGYEISKNYSDAIRHIMKGKRRWMRAWRNSGIMWRSIIRNR